MGKRPTLLFSSRMSILSLTPQISPSSLPLLAVASRTPPTAPTQAHPRQESEELAANDRLASFDVKFEVLIGYILHENTQLAAQGRADRANDTMSRYRSTDHGGGHLGEGHVHY